jgi:hypothetical protein
MKNKINSITKYTCYLLLVLSLLPSVWTKSLAQITTYQYRKVADDKIDSFIYRETTYWSQVAKKAIDNKKLTFWALLEKIGGYDLPNSSNFLFVNTYPDVVQAGDIWNPTSVFPNVPMEKIETGSISTTTSWFFLHGENFAQAAKAVPDKDFKYIKMIYHNSEYPDSLVAMEKKYWSPFIKSAMDKGQTKQVAWGNAIVLGPAGDNIKFNTVSYDLYSTLQEALMPTWDPKTVYPAKGLGMIGKIETNRRGTAFYRIVKVVSAN